MPERYVGIDTETTGLRPDAGDRVIEIGVVEVLGDHIGDCQVWLVNPAGKKSDPGAYAVHKIPDRLLWDEPFFEDVFPEVRDFIAGARLVAHSASFERRFLNLELARIGLPPLPADRFIDTLALARKRWPGQKCDLAHVCERLRIDLSAYKMHRALDDARACARAYILLNREQLRLDVAEPVEPLPEWRPIPPRPTPLPARITDAERAAHAAMVAGLNATCEAECGLDSVWTRLERRKEWGRAA